MDPSISHIAECDDGKALANLLDVFESLCSLEEIASAYCKAGRDVSKAGDILYQLHESNSNSLLHARNGEVGSAQLEEPCSEDNHENARGSKSRTISASMGTVSSVLGKTYTHHRPSKNESSETRKPLKVQVNKALMDALDTEGAASNSISLKKPLHGKDVEEFLFTMLVGFKLSMDDIREVLGQCGYDIRKSMEELLALSAKGLEKGDAINSDGKVLDNRLIESSRSEENHQTHTQGKLNESSKLDKERSNLPRQLLESLFTAPERSEEEPKRTRLDVGLNRRRAVGKTVVSGPPDTVPSTSIMDILRTRQGVDNVLDDENEYQALRRSVKVHWDAMKAYYEQASEAFAKGDRVQASYFMKEGQHYKKLAREADEKSTGYYNKIVRKEDEESAGEIIETSDSRKDGIVADVTLDLHAQSAKEAVHLLKFHISSLANIESFKYLKVIVNSDAEDVTKGKRRRLVIKLLERESITWSEEPENPGTIFIQLDLIDPDELSFAKSSE